MSEQLQSKVDQIFMNALGNCGCYEPKFHAYIALIRQWVQEGCGVSLSYAEAYEFWRWRSDNYDASFLIVVDDPANKADVVEWFEAFVEERFPK